VWIVPLVFIGGIIAAVSIPAYQDYAKRAQVQQPR
jgi:Tfp pilus assembly major pilin PilA